jgi:hypothetical protein
MEKLEPTETKEYNFPKINFKKVFRFILILLFSICMIFYPYQTCATFSKWLYKVYSGFTNNFK